MLYYVLIALVSNFSIPDAVYARMMRLLIGLGFIPLLAVHLPSLLSGGLGTRVILLSSLVVVAACLLHFRYMLQHPSGKNPIRQGHFSLVFVFFIYHLGSFTYRCVSLLSLLESSAVIALMHRLEIIALIPSYLTFGAAILLEKRFVQA